MASPAAAQTTTALVSVRDIAGQLPCRSEFLDVAGRPAFLLLPRKAESSEIPWVWYAPTFATYPNRTHLWMFQQFIENGIAIAGVDIGESYGNPTGRAVFTAFSERLRQDYALAERACLMPQSRGGLMLYNWAAENPQRVAGIAGIYTVCDLRSYPGLATACNAYGMNEASLASHLTEHNPIDRLQPLAKAGLPILHVHGDSDAVVPLEKNSGELAVRYRALGGTMRLIVIPGKGHEEVPEFFRCQELVDFVIAQAKARRSPAEADVPPGVKRIADMEYARGKYFAKKAYAPKSLPTLAETRSKLPSPVYDKDPALPSGVARAEERDSADPAKLPPPPPHAVGFPSRDPKLDALPGFRNPPRGVRRRAVLLVAWRSPDERAAGLATGQARRERRYRGLAGQLRP